MKRFFVVVTAALAALALCTTPAFAQGGTTIGWQGNGSENLPCSGNEHWVLSPAKGITSATLYIDGVPYAMTQNGGGSYSADTNVGFDGSQSVSVTYFGDNDSAFLKLSHCDSGQTTGGTTTGGTDGGTTDGGTTDGGTTDGGTTDGGTTTGGTDGGTTGGGTTGGGTTGGGSTGGGSTGGGSTGGGGVIGSTTGGSGNTSGELPFTGLPVWFPMLLAAALLASGGFLLRRKGGEAS